MCCVWCIMWAYLSRLEGVRLIMRRLLIRRPIISRLSYTLLYCILKMHNTFRMWLVAQRMGLSYHITWLLCFTIALTWIDTCTSICIRIYKRRTGPRTSSVCVRVCVCVCVCMKDDLIIDTFLTRSRLKSIKDLTSNLTGGSDTSC